MIVRSQKRAFGRFGLPTCALALATVLGASWTIGAEADAPAGVATSWPQWRGPLATGASPTANPPTRWSEAENVKWKAKLPGRGSSTPIVWENLVLSQTAIPTGKKGDAAPGAPAAAATAPAIQPAGEPPRGGGPGGRRGGPGGGGGGGVRQERPTEVFQFALLCLDRQTGKTLWQKVLREEVPHEGHHRDHGYSSHSPVTDGKHFVAWFGSRGLHCLDMSGNVVWQKDLGRMQTRLGFGEGTAPALADGIVVVNWDHEGEDFIAAFEQETGKELWRQPRREDTTWSSPLVVRHSGAAQVVVAATNRIRSYDLKTGKQIWECGGMTANVIPTPVADADMVYVISGFRGAALLAITLGRTGDLTGTDAVRWSHAKQTPYVPSPLLYDRRLYYFSGNTNLLTSIDVKTGKPAIEGQRVEGLQAVYASPVAAGGHIYLTGRDGSVVVIKAAEKLEIVATNKLDEQFDASPAVAGKELFLRGQEHLYCIGEK